jgi:hypothetical protein
MSRSSARRAQAEPLAVLAATAVVGVALSAYVGVVPHAMPGERGASVAEPTVKRAVEQLRSDGVVDPVTIPDAAAVAPEGYHLNISVSAGDARWTAGPRPPAGAESASRLAPVSVGDRVAAGRVRVEVWA